MDDVLRPFTNSFVVLYLDDILSSTEHGKRTCNIFNRFWALCNNTNFMPTWKNVFLAWTWYNTWATLLMSMGYMLIQLISKSFVTGQPDHTNRALKLLRTNFYRWFMLGFSHIAWNLSQVTKDGDRENFVWGKEQQRAFEDMKHHLCSSPVLSLCDLQQPFNIETDASDYVMGTVLT